jgi:transcriptional regulator with XRE-family HTH domain
VVLSWYRSCYDQRRMERRPDIARTRRREFGAFLRSRRERLRPADVGLPEGIRRRTPGLRREEIALLAGVGTTWYTWLEQGRDIRASAELLSALARALRLEPAERRHLFVLSGHSLEETPPSGPERVDEPLRRMLTSLTAQPALVVGRRWDILAWNRAAMALFGDYEALKGDDRNIMHLLFADKLHRRLLVDWEELARSSLAMFRADSARYTGDPGFQRLIEALKSASREFRLWWPKHEVLRPVAGLKRIQHPVAGRMVFEYTSFVVVGDSTLKLIVYTPTEESRTNEKLAPLLAKAAARDVADAPNIRQGGLKLGSPAAFKITAS